jgi:hypothetical protein
VVPRLRSHLSYANVMATVALFVALGGSSYAAIALSKNSVKSKHIGKGAVRTADISNGAVNSRKVENFSLSAKDFRPGQIPAGAPGPQGAKGEPGATNVKVRIAKGTDKVTVHCEPGERATGGGAHSVGGFVVGQGPTSTPLAFFSPPDQPPSFVGYTPTAWSAAAVAVDTTGVTGPADVTAWVVCAAP